MINVAGHIRRWPQVPLSILLLAFTIAGCENDPKEIENLSHKELGVEKVINANINYTIGGKAKAVLTAPLMLRVQDTQPFVEFPQLLHVDFYTQPQDSPIIESRLDAKYGKYYETQSKVFLKDSVKIINTQGDTLYCDELWWDRSRTGAEFFTDKPVRIRRRMQIIDGIGMDAPQDFKGWHIVKPVGFVKVPGSEFPE